MAEETRKSHKMYCNEPLYSRVEAAADEAGMKVSEWLRTASQNEIERMEADV